MHVLDFSDPGNKLADVRSIAIAPEAEEDCNMTIAARCIRLVRNTQTSRKAFHIISPTGIVITSVTLKTKTKPSIKSQDYSELGVSEEARMLNL